MSEDAAVSVPVPVEGEKWLLGSGLNDNPKSFPPVREGGVTIDHVGFPRPSNAFRYIVWRYEDGTTDGASFSWWQARVGLGHITKVPA